MTTDEFIPITWKLMDIRDTRSGTDYLFQPDKTISAVPGERLTQSVRRLEEYWLKLLRGEV